MEFTQEAIDALAADESAVVKNVAETLGVKPAQAEAVVALVKEGCTIPFIARYRKERHGSLDEVQVRDCDHLFKSRMNLEERRVEIVKGIFAQGALTEPLYRAAMGAATLAALEDLWAPFKKKKKTRGMAAAEKGLEPLALSMLEDDDALVEEKAKEFVRENLENPALSVPTVDDAINGAKDILAERCAQDGANREAVRAFYMATGRIVTKGAGDESAAKTSTYQMYWDYAEPLSSLKAHRVMAINRGEREGALDVSFDVDVDGAVDIVSRRCAPKNRFHKEAIDDGVARLLSPSVVREIRADEAEAADERGISIFSENLKNLLMTRPIKGSRALGVDPGIRTGTKCAALDETGKYLGSFLIRQAADPEGAREAISGAIKKYGVQIVAIGNGTGSEEVRAVVADAIKDSPSVKYTVVDESGASVYSASDIAREEFPGLDLTIRGAISMARRLQDPLSELVKIDPKSIGVGLYQHDVNQRKLSDALDEVVGSVVNNVGVNLNTASVSLLKYVSGINGATAKKIVAYRDEKGKITSREELKNVKGLGPKAFEQCAGFLKIPESGDPLDNTWVHPENYDAAREALPFIQRGEEIPKELREKIRARYGIGEETLSDIIDELRRPGRDPRDGCPAPIMQRGVSLFEDLREGMKVTGKIKNVVDFGAFVDIGLHETGLLHISEMSDSFVKDPMDKAKVGDVKEFTIISIDKDRRRIGLSLKSDAAARAGKPKPLGESSDGGAKKIVVARKPPRAAQASDRPSTRRPRADSREYQGSADGTMYNPFAALLKK